MHLELANGVECDVAAVVRLPNRRGTVAGVSTSGTSRAMYGGSVRFVRPEWSPQAITRLGGGISGRDVMGWRPPFDRI